MTVVNLNKARKSKTRAEQKATADENALRYGRTKAERLLAAAQVEQAQSRLAALKFEDDE